MIDQNSFKKKPLMVQKKEKTNFSADLFAYIKKK
jgi:hypothetical protein